MSIYDEKPWINAYDDGIAAEIDEPQASYTTLLEEGLRTAPQQPAMHFLGKTFTFQDLDTQSSKFAAFLARNGYGPGDVVGINLPNIPQYLIALAGAIRAGCAVTGISPLLTPDEMVHQINDSGARVLVTLDAIFEHRVQPIREKVPDLAHITVTNITDTLPALKRFLAKLLKKVPTGKMEPIPGKTVLSFMQLLANSPPEKPSVESSLDDTCLIQYTGGTTGLPKGTILTHRNMSAQLNQLTTWLHFESGKEVICSAFPFFHLAGLILCLTSMRTASTQCLIPDPRNTSHICGLIKTYAPTIMANVPTLYQMLLEDPGFTALDFSSVRLCISGAAPFAEESINALESIVGRGKVMEVYGMTETSPMLTMNPMMGKKKIGTVGLPIQSTSIKLVDVETGTKEVSQGEEGELIARGPQVMKGYHNKPAETDHAIREFQGHKWFYTGDVARMDPEGYFSIADRVKDMLIVGGFKVFSREVEEKLYQLPEIEFCAIVGVPDKTRPGSDIVKVFIQLTAEAKDRDPIDMEKGIIAFCREHMAPYKVPKQVEFIPEIPLTSVGKVDKKVLRK